MPDDDETRAADPSRPRDSVETTVDLLARAREGDGTAIERLFARHLRPLQRFARGRLPAWARDLADTDDLVQDALLQTFKRVEAFEPRHPGALQAYLRCTAVTEVTARPPPGPNGSSRYVQAHGPRAGPRAAAGATRRTSPGAREGPAGIHGVPQRQPCGPLGCRAVAGHLLSMRGARPRAQSAVVPGITASSPS